jgi:hypothetical protein
VCKYKYKLFFIVILIQDSVMKASKETHHPLGKFICKETGEEILVPSKYLPTDDPEKNKRRILKLALIVFTRKKDNMSVINEYREKLERAEKRKEELLEDISRISIMHETELNNETIDLKHKIEDLEYELYCSKQ